ncbi:hypothetical protein BD309DRAFT_687428 [Dichomitus squalens]|nr:hypothetical protein BD309DRAFT_687428 [Dichomitus squalens]
MEIRDNDALTLNDPQAHQTSSTRGSDHQWENCSTVAMSRRSAKRSPNKTPSVRVEAETARFVTLDPDFDVRERLVPNAQTGRCHHLIGHSRGTERQEWRFVGLRRLAAFLGYRRAWDRRRTLSAGWSIRRTRTTAGCGTKRRFSHALENDSMANVEEAHGSVYEGLEVPRERSTCTKPGRELAAETPRGRPQ